MALMSTLRHTPFLSFVVFVVNFLMYIFERWVRALCVCAFMTFKCHFEMKSSCQYAYYGFEYLPIPIWLVRFTNDIWYLCTFVRSFDERLDFTLDRFVFIYLLIERTNERNKSKVRKRKTWIESRCICVCVCEMKQRVESTFKIAYLLCFALHTYTYVCLLNTFQSHSNNRKKTGFFSLIVLEF